MGVHPELDKTREDRTINGNEYIAKILKQEGVDLMTCYPSNPIIEAAAKEGIRPVAFRHERGAIMAADGISRTSDRQKFGVVAIQSQAGAENAVGGSPKHTPIIFQYLCYQEACS